MELRRVEDILQTYTLSEILEFNNLTEEDVLYFLIEQHFLRLPDPEPL